jgi:L-ascorbate oxidase
MIKLFLILAHFIIAFSFGAFAGTYNLTVDEVTLNAGAFKKKAIGYNGSTPGPILRFKEGEEVVINVKNNLNVPTSIHWHGLILPFNQDGVPKISFPGIMPGETFTYKFPIVQSGTYWFHSHSGFQEPDGAYGAIVIESKKREPFVYDRDYVIQLTDAHPHSGDRIMRNLKMMPDYYNRQQETVSDFVKESKKFGFKKTLEDRKSWGSMRMMKTDIEDVQGFVPLINGKTAKDNWTALFKKGEKVRLRFINSSAMTYFDIKIPGLKMTVVAADGKNVQPVSVDEFRIAVAETYDVIVKPEEDIAYTIFAASMARTAYARATLTPREGMQGEIPVLGDKPTLTMADMGGMHGDHGSMDHSKHNMSGMDHSKHNMSGMDHSKHNMSGMDHSKHNMR